MTLEALYKYKILRAVCNIVVPQVTHIHGDQSLVVIS